MIYFKIDSILPICMNKTESFEGKKNADDYSKQCIANKTAMEK